jgi:translation initiation factor IF-2
MSKVRVYEVAKQLNMDQKSLVAAFQSMGLSEVRNHMSAVEADVVERLKRHLERQKTPEVVEERIRPTVVKRRARATDGDVPAARPSSAGSAAPEAAPSQRLVPPPPSDRGVPAARPSSSSSEAARPVPEATPSSRAVPPARRSQAATPAPAPSVREAALHAHPEPAAVTPVVEKPAPSTRGRAAAVVAEAPAEPASSVSSAEPAPKSATSSRARSGAAKDSKAGAAPAKTAVESLDFDSDPARAEPARVEPAVHAEPAPVAAAPAAAPAAEPPPSAPPPSAPPPSAPPAMVSSSSPPASVDAPRRPSTPPRTGIDVWQGRPGVPMPQARATTPPARRTTYDPRAASAAARPSAGFQPRPPMGGRGRPGFGQQGRGRPGMTSGLASKRPMPITEMAAHKKVIKIEENVSLQKLAALMSLKVTDVLMRLLSMGMSGVNINSTIDADTAKILASEFGWTVEDVAVSEEATLEAAMGLTDDSEAPTESRPPIVTVMGHVDHGKTSLLDRIRKTTVASGEAGGITQHIGAYRVETAKGVLAFLDTPGHEAFTAMRARGAQVTDIVILVVAADDGVMPQTREAITHAQQAKVPIIVAVNKMDKPSADLDRVKRELSALGLAPEDWGGDTMYVPISALTGMGIDALLDAVLLQAEVLELTSSPNRRASGVVVEALLDRGRGPVARVMVQDGTLRVGDVIVAGSSYGKVRAMTDELGRAVAKAGPSTPVEVLGLTEVPSAGDPVHAVKDAKTAEEISEGRRKKASKSLIPADSRVSLDALTQRLAEADQLELKLIIKGDVQGSVEAVVAALLKLSSPKVKVTLVHAGVGAITEGDVNLAIASKAIIVGFNVRPAGKAGAHAEAGGVEIRTYNIIYNAVDDIRTAMEGLLPTTKLEKALGKAEVRKVFKLTKIGVVAGCMVVSGLIRRNMEARVLRDGSVVHTAKIGGLRRMKDDVREVPEGMECGISFEGFQDFKEGDIIECFEIEEVKQKLD